MPPAPPPPKLCARGRVVRSRQRPIRSATTPKARRIGARTPDGAARCPRQGAHQSGTKQEVRVQRRRAMEQRRAAVEVRHARQGGQRAALLRRRRRRRSSLHVRQARLLPPAPDRGNCRGLSGVVWSAQRRIAKGRDDVALEWFPHVCVMRGPLALRRDGHARKSTWAHCLHTRRSCWAGDRGCGAQQLARRLRALPRGEAAGRGRGADRVALGGRRV